MFFLILMTIFCFVGSYSSHAAEDDLVSIVTYSTSYRNGEVPPALNLGQTMVPLESGVGHTPLSPSASATFSEHDMNLSIAFHQEFIENMEHNKVDLHRKLGERTTDVPLKLFVLDQFNMLEGIIFHVIDENNKLRYDLGKANLRVCTLNAELSVLRIREAGEVH